MPFVFLQTALDLLTTAAAASVNGGEMRAAAGAASDHKEVGLLNSLFVLAHQMPLLLIIYKAF